MPSFIFAIRLSVVCHYVASGLVKVYQFGRENQGKTGGGYLWGQGEKWPSVGHPRPIVLLC